MQSQMNMLELLLQGLFVTQHHANEHNNGAGAYQVRNGDTTTIRVPADPTKAQEIELEVMRRTKAMN